jgi:hypothetical protein
MRRKDVSSPFTSVREANGGARGRVSEKQYMGHASYEAVSDAQGKAVYACMLEMTG